MIFIESTQQDKEIRRSVVKKIKDVVLSSYPEARVMVFGACASELNLPNSDIDLLVYNP